MRLIILHGPPGSGKLTVAKALSKELGYNIMHNHLSVDLALAVYPEFGHGDFFEFVDSLRLMSIRKACENGQKGLIVTQCFDQLLDVESLNLWLEVIAEFKGEVIPVYLDVPVTELKKRVLDESRQGTNKLQCPVKLVEALKANLFGPIVSPVSHIIQSANLTVIETTKKIQSALG